MKFSIRSEDSNIHAGNLIRSALKDIGNGGGHPTMAGGIIYKKYLDKIDNIEDKVIELFTAAYKRMENSKI